jgi:hypothetical protein
MGNKISGLKAPLMNMTNMTEIEFANLYNVSDEKSLGYTIAQVDKVIATQYKCASTDLCTSTELSVMQWTKSTVT